jgi:hypothetical protein
LPEDSYLVGGVHLAQLREQPDGKKLMSELSARNADFGVGRIATWTGLKSEDIDHLAFGLSPGEALKGFTVVVRTRQPYSRAALADAVRPAKATDYLGRPLYRIQTEGPRRMIWCYDDKTLIVRVGIVGVSPDDLKKIPDQPRTGAAGLPAEVRHVLAKRLNKNALAWVAGNLNRAGDLLTLLAFNSKVPQQVGQLLSDLDAFGLGMRLHNGVTLDGSFQCKDPGTALELQRFFKQAAQKDVKVTVFGPQSAIAPPDQEEQRWVLLQMRMSTDRALEVVADPKSLLARE